MASMTKPLHDEHQTLLPRVEALRTTADSVGAADQDVLRAAVNEAYEFLTGSLMPHAAAEEQVLYPAVQRVMGAPQATATMSRDHAEVDRLRQELASLRPALAAAPLTPAQTNELRRVLYGLYTLLRVHFAKEEEVYLPILDEHLSQNDANALFEQMERAAREAWKRS